MDSARGGSHGHEPTTRVATHLGGTGIMLVGRRAAALDREPGGYYLTGSGVRAFAVRHRAGFSKRRSRRAESSGLSRVVVTSALRRDAARSPPSPVRPLQESRTICERAELPRRQHAARKLLPSRHSGVADVTDAVPTFAPSAPAIGASATSGETRTSKRSSGRMVERRIARSHAGHLPIARHAVLVKPVLDLAHADPQKLCRARRRAIARLERLEDRLPLDRIHSCARDAHAAPRRRVVVLDVLEPDERTLRQHDGALDGVLQRPHIRGPTGGPRATPSPRRRTPRCAFGSPS